MSGTKVYALMQASWSKGYAGDFHDFDVYGIYSSKETAEEVMKALKREDRKYDGITENYIFDVAWVVERIIDNNFP